MQALTTNIVDFKLHFAVMMLSFYEFRQLSLLATILILLLRDTTGRPKNHNRDERHPQRARNRPDASVHCFLVVFAGSLGGEDIFASFS
jgi:hypothetical protein